MNEEITKDVSLQHNVPATSWVELSELVPLTGRVASVTMHFPDGCNGLVHMALGYGDTWLMPSDVNTYISLNNATPTFPCSEPVKQNEHFWVKIQNGDAFDHRVSVIITVVGRVQ